MNNFIDELRRRNVFRVAGVYAVIGWVLAQISTTLEEALGLPVWFDAAIVAVLLLGLPIALVLAWAFELTPDGVLRTEAVPVGAYDVIPVHFYMWDESHKYYRRSPQFKAYMKASGVFDYWHEHGFPPQCRPVGDDDFDCD